MSSTGQALHRLGFVLKRPKKRLLKADPVRREAFVAEYAALEVAARRTGAKVFFADEAHFQADADLRGKWALKGEPAPVSGYGAGSGGLHQPTPWGEVSYYSAVCLETGEVEVMELEGNPPQADHLHHLPAATAGATQRTAHRDLGQLPSPSGRRDPGLSHHTQPEPAPGELAQLQSGLQR